MQIGTGLAGRDSVRWGRRPLNWLFEAIIGIVVGNSFIPVAVRFVVPRL